MLWMSLQHIYHLTVTISFLNLRLCSFIYLMSLYACKKKKKITPILESDFPRCISTLQTQQLFINDINHPSIFYACFLPLTQGCNRFKNKSRKISLWTTYEASAMETVTNTYQRVSIQYTVGHPFVLKGPFLCISWNYLDAGGNHRHCCAPWASTNQTLSSRVNCM